MEEPFTRVSESRHPLVDSCSMMKTVWTVRPSFRSRGRWSRTLGGWRDTVVVRTVVPRGDVAPSKRAGCSTWNYPWSTCVGGTGPFMRWLSTSWQATGVLINRHEGPSVWFDRRETRTAVFHVERSTSNWEAHHRRCRGSPTPRLL